MLLAALKFAGVGWALLAGAAYAQESPQGLVAPSASESRLLEMLDEAVAYLSERLPFQLDFSTRLIGVRRDGRTLVYQYQVERVSRRELQGHATALGRRTCNNRQLFNLMTIGGAVRYSYELKESGQQVVHEITLDHCGAREITL